MCGALKTTTKRFQEDNEISQGRGDRKAGCGERERKRERERERERERDVLLIFTICL